MPSKASLLRWPICLAAASISANVGAVSPDRCVDIEADSARLACYDAANGRRKASAVTAESSPDIRAIPVSNDAPLSPMQTAWGVPGDSGGLYAVRPYQPVYLFPVFHSNHVNHSPHTPTQPALEALPIEATEAKFQLSLKTKLASNLLGDNGDLWGAYTQSSRWQVYTGNISRPFRESNYEPEAMFVWKTNYKLLGVRMPFTSIGINHQSNGRSKPLSRSWNRVIGQVGFEKDSWTATLRLWQRIKEKVENDDNPDIVNFAGRGELLLTKSMGGHQLTALIRPTLAGGQHGAVRLDWAFPLLGGLKGHVQWFNGYGESLIDYNHRAQYLGLGISLIEWY